MGSGLLGEVHALHELAGGDVVAAATSGSASPLRHVARWNGATWSHLTVGTNRRVRSIAALPDGDLVLGGALTAAGGVASGYVARVTTTCPATVTTVATGCASSGGANVLAATTLPWLGSMFRMVATGLPALALVAHVTSTTPIAPGMAPLSTLLAQGVPGCDLLVSPELLQASVTTTGVAESTLALPSSQALVGLTFDHQLVPFELDAQLQFVAITDELAARGLRHVLIFAAHRTARRDPGGNAG